MSEYFIKKDEFAIGDAHRAAEYAFQSVRDFVQAYNELRAEAAAMPETKEEMPVLNTETLHSLLKNPQYIKDLYFKTIAIPEMAGGFKVKIETLDIEHADYETATSYAEAAKATINKQRGGSFDAFVMREEGSKVIISDKWKEAVEERYTKRAETPVEKKVYDALKQILAIREEVEKTTRININFSAFQPGMGLRPFRDIYESILPYPRRTELIEADAAR